jgi:hypothetical protein
MNFISDPSNGYNQTNLNTLKFHLVGQSITETTTTEEETVVGGVCAVDADIYVYYDHTSMGPAARANAWESINDWVIDMQTTQGFDKNVYHKKANDEQWLKWGYTTLAYPGSYSKEPAHEDAAGLGTAYTGGTYNVLTDQFPNTPPGGDVLVICFLDEAVPVYVSGVAEEGNTNFICDPNFDAGTPGNAGPWDTSSTWEEDYNNYVAAYNAYTTGNVACFFYPTAPVSETTVFEGVGNGFSSTMLGALAGITSGDNNNGLLANPPISQHGVETSHCPGGQEFNALKTSNPYFVNGYGGLNALNSCPPGQ